MIQEKLATIQSELKAPKSNYNDFGKYRYRSCEDILEAVKPLLNGCTITMSDELMFLGTRYYVKATATLHNGNESISVSAYARESESKKGMDESQITGTASSYARKYALNGLFAIDDQKDDDTRPPTDKKPDLIEGTPEWVRVVKAIKDGFTINDVEKKYTLSDEIKNRLAEI